MRRRIDVQKLAAALWGGVGAFVLGFFGSEAMFAPLSEGIALTATLIPSAAAAVGVGLWLFLSPDDVVSEQAGEVVHLQVQPSERAAPTSPSKHRAA